MIDRKENKDKTEYELDQIVQASFGYSDEQLLEQMDMAEEMVDDDQIPPEPEDGFAQLMAKAESRGIIPYSEAKDSDKEERKIRRLGPLIKVGLAVAVLSSVLLMTSITAGAKRSYKYEARTRVEMKGDTVLNSAENVLKKDRLEDAYKSIKEQIGINVLRFGEIPKGLVYLKISINDERALLYFTYNGEHVHFVQQKGIKEKSINFDTDRKENDTVYNSWLKEKIPITSAEVDDGQEEYSASIIANNSYYYFSGIMEKEVFKAIVGDMRYIE